MSEIEPSKTASAQSSANGATSTDGLGGWLPIDTAPKDARILLGYENKIFNGIFSVCGHWDKDEYAKNPKPYWTHDMEMLRGKRETKAQQPIGWMLLPNPPNV